MIRMPAVHLPSLTDSQPLPTQGRERGQPGGAFAVVVFVLMDRILAQTNGALAPFLTV